jgi:hypothetical protein
MTLAAAKEVQLATSGILERCRSNGKRGSPVRRGIKKIDTCREEGSEA